MKTKLLAHVCKLPAHNCADPISKETLSLHRRSLWK